MGFYREQLLPRFQDKVMARKPNRMVRARVCDGLQGAVVEVGFGTALNVPYYPPEVSKVVAIEPSRVCMRIAEPRIAQTSIPIEYGGLTGEHLDLPSAEFDAVLSTWTLCTIPDLEAALAEMRRVLKSGGSFHFVEHGHSPDETVNDGPVDIHHLTRHISEDVERAGFEIEKIESYYFKGEPKPMGYTYEGRAVSR